MKKSAKITPFSGTLLDPDSQLNHAALMPRIAIQQDPQIPKVKSHGKRIWRGYSNCRRKYRFSKSPLDDLDRKRLSGPGLCPDLKLETYGCYDADPSGDTDVIETQIKTTLNRNLIQYFARLSDSKQPVDYIDLEFVETLVQSGADIETTDTYGQTPLHEVARAWSVSVAKFVVEYLGADVNTGDERGRTPLHIAAAVDYPEMCAYLISIGADREARTNGESQTPVFFAARNDSDLALKVLLKNRCRFKKVKDYKGRSPIAVAAEMNRSKSVKLLLDMGAPADSRDDSGQPAIVPIVSRMGPLANMALDQFVITDSANRKQHFHLWKLEPYESDDPSNRQYNGVLQTIVYHRHYDLVMHPVIKRLIDVKWNDFAKIRVYGQVLYQFIFVAAWSTVCLATPWMYSYQFNLPADSWRIVVHGFALILTLCQVIEEIQEIKSFWKMDRERKMWKQKEIDRDKRFCHPLWKNEIEFLEQEETTLNSISPSYFADGWNIFDWICYSLVIVVTVIHVMDVFFHSIELARYHVRVQAVTLIIIWLRLMKIARAFELVGPFIVIFTRVMMDIAKFLYLYMEFYIPFVFAFYITIGGTENPTEAYINQDSSLPANYTKVVVTGFTSFNDAMFSLFRMTLIGNYDYEDMIRIDKIMSQLLVGFWFAISNILCINLLIALLSDTFARVYDNAQENACMQRAITILNVMDGLYDNRLRKFCQRFQENCNPEVIYFDLAGLGDPDNDLKKITVETNEIIHDIQRQLLDFINREDEEDEDEPVDEDGYAYTYRRKSMVAGFDHSQKKADRSTPNSPNREVPTSDSTNEIDVKKVFSDFEARQASAMKKMQSDINELKTLVADIGVVVASFAEQGGSPSEDHLPRRKKKRRFRSLSANESAPRSSTIQVAPPQPPMQLETYTNPDNPSVRFIEPPAYGENSC